MMKQIDVLFAIWKEPVLKRKVNPLKDTSELSIVSGTISTISSICRVKTDWSITEQNLISMINSKVTIYRGSQSKEQWVSPIKLWMTIKKKSKQLLTKDSLISKRNSLICLPSILVQIQNNNNLCFNSFFISWFVCCIHMCVLIYLVWKKYYLTISWTFSQLKLEGSK